LGLVSTCACLLRLSGRARPGPAGRAGGAGEPDGCDVRLRVQFEILVQQRLQEARGRHAQPVPAKARRP